MKPINFYFFLDAHVLRAQIVIFSESVKLNCNSFFSYLQFYFYLKWQFYSDSMWWFELNKFMFLKMNKYMCLYIQHKLFFKMKQRDCNDSVTTKDCYKNVKKKMFCFQYLEAWNILSIVKNNIIEHHSKH